MKKVVLTLVLILSVFATVNAQFTKVGGGLTYGTGFQFNNVTSPSYEKILHRGPSAGLFLSGIYELSLPFHISPSFTFFLPRTNTASTGFNDQKTRVSSMMFDINAHYVFNSLDRFEFYGLAGLNITLAKLKWVGSTSSGSDNALGLNLGVGTYFKMTEQFDLFGEAKYILSKYDQLMINAGILVNIDWLKKNENSEL